MPLEGRCFRGQRTEDRDRDRDRGTQFLGGINGGTGVYSKRGKM